MRPGLGVSGRPISPHFPHEVHRGFLGRAAAVNTYGNSVPRGNSETLATIAGTAKMVRGSKSADSEIHKLDLLYDQPNPQEGDDDAYKLTEIN